MCRHSLNPSNPTKQNPKTLFSSDLGFLKFKLRIEIVRLYFNLQFFYTFFH